MKPTEPRTGTRAARVLERLRCGAIHLHRDATRLRATPGQVLRSIAALRQSFDMEIRLAGRAAYELRPGRYSERGYRGRQLGLVPTSVLDLLQAHGELGGSELVSRSGFARERIRCALVCLLRAQRIVRVGWNRYALAERDLGGNTSGNLQAKVG